MPKWLNKPVAGFLFYDFANSAFATTVLAVIFNRYYSEVLAGGAAGTHIDLGLWRGQVPGVSLWNLVVAASMAVVAVISPLLGALADRAAWKRRMLIMFCYTGVACTCLLWGVEKGDLLLASALFIGANVAFSAGNSIYNAFLNQISSPEDYGKISGAAWGFGYLGGGICLVLNMVMLSKPELLGFPAGTFGVGSCVLVAGLWWGVFAIPTILWLKDAPLPASPPTHLRHLTGEAWHKVISTMRQVNRYRQLVRFLIAYLIFNDAIETVIVVASIFGGQVVGLTTPELVVYFVMIQGTAFLGSLLFGWLADRLGQKRTLMLSLAIWLGVVVWAYEIGWFIDKRTDFYIIGVLAGLVMGGSQSVARSLQALFTPSNQTAEFFGFFSLSGKFASVFGSATFAVAVMATGSLGAGILALGAFFIVGGAILATVNIEEGIEMANLENSDC